MCFGAIIKSLECLMNRGLRLHSPDFGGFGFVGGLRLVFPMGISFLRNISLQYKKYNILQANKECLELAISKACILALDNGEAQLVASVVAEKANHISSI
jgi:hypothetical protein